MDGPSAFSSDGAEVIARHVDLVEQAAKTGSLGRDDDDLALEEYYEVEYTVQEILSHGFKRVTHISWSSPNITNTSLQIALQFSDDMLGDSVPVYIALKKRLHAADADGQMSKSLTVDLARDTRSLFILADTSYGRSPSSSHIPLQMSDRPSCQLLRRRSGRSACECGRNCTLWARVHESVSGLSS
jgi:hypothetical protein